MLLLVVLCGLSYWQWHRAELKTGIMNQFLANTQAPSLKLSELPNVGSTVDARDRAQYRYRTVNLTGHYLSQYTLFIDNKLHQHQVGYHVVTPFLDQASQSVLMVDRGFVARPNNRLDLPRFLPSEKTTTITAQLDLPTDNPWLLGANEEQTLQGDRVLQQLDLESEQKLYRPPLKDYLGLLQSEPMAGLVLPEAGAPYLTPERHRGYSLQWALLALALLVIYLVTNLEKRV